MIYIYIYIYIYTIIIKSFNNGIYTVWHVMSCMQCNICGNQKLMLFSYDIYVYIYISYENSINFYIYIYIYIYAHSFHNGMYTVWHVMSCMQFNIYHLPKPDTQASKML